MHGRQKKQKAHWTILVYISARPQSKLESQSREFLIRCFRKKLKIISSLCLDLCESRCVDIFSYIYVYWRFYIGEKNNFRVQSTEAWGRKFRATRDGAKDGCSGVGRWRTGAWKFPFGFSHKEENKKLSLLDMRTNRTHSFIEMESTDDDVDDNSKTKVYRSC